MPRVYYNKLIRDRIKEKIENEGSECKVRVIEEGKEFEQELLKKVAEEAGALSRIRTRGEFFDEYADLMAVLDALTAYYDFSPADIKVALEENMKKKGGFKEKLFLHWSTDSGYKSNETPQGVKE